MVWVVAAALVAGILQKPLYIVPAVLSLVAFVARHRSGARRTLFLLATVGVFWWYGYSAMERVGERAMLFDSFTDSVVIEGWVSSFPKPGFGRTEFDLTCSVRESIIRVRVRAHEFTIGYGDSVRVRGLPGLSPRSRIDPDSRVGYGIAGWVRAAPGGVERRPGHAGNAVTRAVLWPLHSHARQIAARHIGAPSSLPLALLLGERGFIDPKLRGTFVALGISHLLALSGLHLGFVAAFVWLALAALRVRNTAAVLALLAMYVGVVGPILSLLRAFIMAAVLMVARALHRPLRTIESLGDALVIMLLVYPFALFSVAFQLSFLATFAVLLCVSRLGAPRHDSVLGKVAAAVRSILWISTVVQVVLAPVILYYFGRISLVAPFSTAVFVLPTAVLLLLTALTVGVGAAAPGHAEPLFLVVGKAARLFGDGLQWAARVAPEPLSLPVPDFIGFYAGLAVVWWGRRWWLRAAGVLLCGAAFLWPLLW